VAGQVREGQHLDAVEPVGLVIRGVSPVYSGIDRYLYGAARSSRVLQQVNRHPATLANDVFRRHLAQHNFHSIAPDPALTLSHGHSRFEFTWFRRPTQQQSVDGCDARWMHRLAALQAAGRFAAE
jgi:hypothetical protein